MLSAQKEDNRVDSILANSEAQTLGGFSRVLNSIHGLQQRLEGFSVDDVSSAQDNAKNLILRLSQLQKILGNIAELRHSISATNGAIIDAPYENYDAIALDSLAKHPQLHAIVQASKVIRFRRLIQAVKENSAVDSLDVIVDELNFRSSGKVTNPTVIEQPTSRENRFEGFTLQTDGIPDSASELAETVNKSSTIEISDPRDSLAEWLNPVQAIPSPEATISTKPEESEPHFHSDAEVVTAEPAQPGRQTPNSFEIAKETKSRVHEDGNIDQRLLDDLIKNYGEFAIFPNLPAPVEPTELSKAKPIQSVSIGVAQTKAPEFPERNLPSLKKRDDLDRQLKKIIKDYGEYDLYSRQSPINVKTGVIAAFALLGILWFGFYLFKSPKSAIEPKAATVTQSGTDSPTGSDQPATNLDSPGENNGNEKNKEKVGEQ